MGRGKQGAWLDAASPMGRGFMGAWSTGSSAGGVRRGRGLWAWPSGAGSRAPLWARPRIPRDPEYLGAPWGPAEPCGSLEPVHLAEPRGSLGAPGIPWSLLCPLDLWIPLVSGSLG